MLAVILKWITTGPLDRILSTVDKKVQATTDKEKIKGDIIQEHYRNRGDWMRAGGFWLMLLFAAPLGLWFSSVVVYSVFWCQGCAYPQSWHIAALPAPLDDWSAGIIVSIFGVVGVSRFRK